MNIRLPNGEKKSLDSNLPFEQRQEIVDSLLAEWEDHFRENWNNQSTMVCLEVLANYLILSQKDKNDKEVISMKRMKQMKRGSKLNVNFSDLTYDQKVDMGFDMDEVSEND